MEFGDIVKVFSSRDDLKKYGENALLLWAIQIRYGIEDIETFASNYLTDGSSDEKCDLIWVNRDDGFAIIAQSYYKATGYNSGEAKANKASDLNTAVAWAFGDTPIEKLPEKIRSGIKDLREALEEGEIHSLYIYYVHNMGESANVKRQLDQVETTAERFLRPREVNVATEEIGQESLVEWYESVENPILITDDFEITCKDGYEIAGKRWKAFSTYISAREIHQYHNKYGEKLFVGNPRGYLGLRRSDENINFGIRKSAEEDPDNFWVYHNGISIFVNDYRRRGGKLKFSGISIVNGAQTTGVIGNLETEPSEDVKIPVRFIKASDRQILRAISRNNNSQNRMQPADFRSTDSTQKRLVNEFLNYPGNLSYAGGRRGGETDAISRDPNLIPSDTVAQSLTAFHGKPDMAYKYKGQIWTENEAYNRIFNDRTTSRHILFVYSLHKRILTAKQDLLNLEKSGEPLTQIQQSTLSFLSQRGSVFLVIYAISHSIETFLGNPVANRFSLEFKSDADIATLEGNWGSVVDSVLAFSKTLNEGFRKYSFTVEDINSSVDQFGELIQSTAAANKEIYDNFASLVAHKD